MGNSKLTVMAATLVFSASSVALAQNVHTTPISNWSYQHHSSTATEGFLRGRAAVVQAAGQTNYLNSIAAVNLQEANKRAIENRGLYVRTYFENKEINRQYREKYASTPVTAEQWARIVEASVPKRLTAEQFDPATGALVWPHILRTDAYKAIRERIDELVATRSPDNSGDGSPSQRELASLVNAMKLLLKGNIDTVTGSQYGTAKRFLQSLDYEAQLSKTNTSVAAASAPATTVN